MKQNSLTVPGVVLAALLPQMSPTTLSPPLEATSRWHVTNGIPAGNFYYAQSQLQKITELQANWDGYGGLPIHSDTAVNAKAALEVFQLANITPEITPNSNGTISFEWASSKGRAHVEVGKIRFVGILRPKGNADIPVGWSAAPNRSFHEAIEVVCNALISSLFPAEIPPMSTYTFAAHARSAA